MLTCARKRRGTVGGEARACMPATCPSPDLAIVRGEINYADTYVTDFTVYIFDGDDISGTLYPADAAAELISTLSPDKTSRLRCVVLNGCDTFEIGVDIVHAMPHLGVVCDQPAGGELSRGVRVRRRNRVTRATLLLLDHKRRTAQP